MNQEKNKNRRDRSLKFKLNLTLVSVVTLLLVIFGIYDIWKENVSLTTQLKESSELISTALSKKLAFSLWELDDELANEAIDFEMQSNLDIVSILILDLDGKTHFTGKLRNSKGGIVNYGNNQNISSKIVKKKKIEQNEKHIGFVQLSLTDKNVKEQLKKFLFLTILRIIIIDILLISILSGLISKMIIVPLGFLKFQIDEFGKGRLGTKALVDNNDEIGELANSFTLMMSQITQAQTDLENKVEERTVELKDSEKRSRSIIETANDAFVAIDDKSMIQQWNHKAEEVFSWKAEEVVGKKYLHDIIIPQQHREAHKKGMKHYLETGVGPVLNKTIEITALKRDGNEFPIELTIWPLQSGQTYQFNAFIRDITERKKMEDKIKQANEKLLADEMKLKLIIENLENAHEELKQAQSQLVQSEKMASIGMLAAGIAHEINNPIGFIGNNLEIFNQFLIGNKKLLSQMEKIKQAVNKNDIKEADRFINEMKGIEEEINLDYFSNELPGLIKDAQKGVERVEKIVLDLRTFTREDKGLVNSLNVNEILDDIIRIIWSEIKYNCELKKDYGNIPSINGSSQKLGQVFMNLLINASQAIEEKGKISIKTYAQNDHVYIEISDNGKGIEEESVKKIFDAFYTTKPVGEGTGLGLSISSEIIKKHGGEINVESEIGKGTTFRVCLPINANSEDT